MIDRNKVCKLSATRNLEGREAEVRLLTVVDGDRTSTGNVFKRHLRLL